MSSCSASCTRSPSQPHHHHHHPYTYTTARALLSTTSTTSLTTPNMTLVQAPDHGLLASLLKRAEEITTNATAL